VARFPPANHAQGVAAAAQLLKTAGNHRDAEGRAGVETRAHQILCAEVVLYDRDREDREAIARGLRRKTGRATLVKPYDDPLIIAGQGTAGREIAETWPRSGCAHIVWRKASGAP